MVGREADLVCAGAEDLLTDERSVRPADGFIFPEAPRLPVTALRSRFKAPDASRLEIRPEADTLLSRAETAAAERCAEADAPLMRSDPCWLLLFREIAPS